MDQPPRRVLNLTPHALHIYLDHSPVPIVIPSDGELRLLSEPSKASLADLQPLSFSRIADDRGPARLDVNSAGYQHLRTLRNVDAAIVSMPVAQWLVTKTDLPCKVYSPGTGPSSVVRYGDEEPSRKGQIKGVRALEYHPRV
jgi:hypothetical protein